MRANAIPFKTFSAALVTSALLALAVTPSSAKTVSGPISSFGKNGLFTPPPVGPGDTEVSQCAISTTGQLVMLYESVQRSKRTRRRLSARWAIAKTNSRGRPIRTFGRRGVVQSIAGLKGTAEAAIIDAGGGTIVAFKTKSTVAKPARLLIVRLDSRGRIDTTFGASGIVESGLPARSSVPKLLQIDDGSIIVAVTESVDTDSSRLAASVVTSTGLDLSFGTNGRLAIDKFSLVDVAFANGSIYFGSIATGKAGEPPSGGVVLKFDRHGIADATWGSLGRFALEPGVDVVALHAATDNTLRVLGTDVLNGDQEETAQYWSMEVSPIGVESNGSRIKVWEDTDILNEQDNVDDEHFDVGAAYESDGTLALAAFGSGKEKYSVLGRMLVSGGKLVNFRRRPAAGFDVPAVAGVTDNGRSLLICGDKYRRKHGRASAFKLALP